MNNPTHLDSPASPQTTLDQSTPVATHLDQGATQTAAHIHVQLPPTLANRFKIVRLFPTPGAEADILLVQAINAALPVVLKLYRPGIQPKTEVLQRIANAAPEHVIQLHEHGQAEGVWYEILEYAAHGSLRELMRGPMPPAQAKVILDELVPALSHLHAQQIIHRDLKPENILVRNLWPLDLALTDFGIASISEHSQRHTNLSRTIRYSAPESASGVITAKADWWSLGIMLLELLTGKHPFENLSDAVILNWLMTRPVDVPVNDQQWQKLCRGLLVRDPKHRWAADEIFRWAQGESVDVISELALDIHSTESRLHRPYHIGDKICQTPEQLAEALATNWQEGIKHLARGLILAWLRDEVQDQALICFCMDIAEEDLPSHEKLLKLIHKLAPTLPPLYREIALSQDNLLVLAKQAMQKDESAQNLLWEIYDRDILGYFQDHPVLRELRSQWRSGVETYTTGWQTVIEAGASEQSNTALTLAMPRLFLCLFNTTYAENLRKYINVVAAPLPNRSHWYFSLGDPKELAVAHLPVLTVLNPDAPQKPNVNERYVDNFDGTITDTETGLQWMKCALGQEKFGSDGRGDAETFNWEAAILAASQFNQRGGFAGYFDWRVPLIKELKTLVISNPKPVIVGIVASSNKIRNFWSATPFPQNNTGAWYVDFKEGRENFGFRGNSYAVRLVRIASK